MPYRTTGYKIQTNPPRKCISETARRCAEQAGRQQAPHPPPLCPHHPGRTKPDGQAGGITLTLLELPIHYLRDISSESTYILNHGIITGCEQKRLVFSSPLVFSLLPDGCIGTDGHPISAVQPGPGQFPTGDEDR